MNEQDANEIANRVRTLQDRRVNLVSHQRVIQSQLNAASRELRWNKLTASFLLTSIHLRPLADKLQTGRWFVVLVGTAVLAATCFVFADILIGFRGFSIISGVSIAIATAAAASYSDFSASVALNRTESSRFCFADSCVIHSFYGLCTNVARC